MLTQEPLNYSGPTPGNTRGPGSGTVAMLVVAFFVVLILRHDYWWWKDARPLLFGFLPVGLWWQGLVSILACIMMWLMVRFAWPGRLELDAIEYENRRLAQEAEAANPPRTNHGA
jgi:hypothetical protein